MKILRFHRAAEGYEKISRCLRIETRTGKSVIQKGKKQEHSVRYQRMSEK